MERRPEGEGEGARKGQAGSRGWGGGGVQAAGGYGYCEGFQAGKTICCLLLNAWSERSKARTLLFPPS